MCCDYYKYTSPMLLPLLSTLLFLMSWFLLFLAIREVEDSHELLEKTVLKLRVDQKGNSHKSLNLFL